MASTTTSTTTPRDGRVMAQIRAQALATIRDQASHWPASMLRDAARHVAGQPPHVQPLGTQLTTYCATWQRIYGTTLLVSVLETSAHLRALAERNCQWELRALLAGEDVTPGQLEDIETAGVLVAESLEGHGDVRAARSAAEAVGVFDLCRRYGGYVVQQAAQDVIADYEACVRRA